MGISDEIEVPTIAIDETTTLAIKATINKSSQILEFRQGIDQFEHRNYQTSDN